MTTTDDTDPTPNQSDSGVRPRQSQRSELANWIEMVDRTRAIIREQIGDQPIPDIDEMIDAGRDEWLDDLMADLQRRKEQRDARDRERD
ncbi:MAG: hypothetical protein ACRDJH_17650 [Thermomicrobiales bacterium]